MDDEVADIRCFFAGGVRFAEQTIKSTAAQLNASLLLIAVIAVLIPSAFHFSITTSETGDGMSPSGIVSLYTDTQV
jgi:Ca2+:H+ antiporter